MESTTVVKRQSTFAITFVPRTLAPISAWLEGTAVPMAGSQGIGGDHKRTYRRRQLNHPDFAPGT
ncbi:hypothetical protein ACWFNE_04410 [Cellulomonas sp. NPDC055163]